MNSTKTNIFELPLSAVPSYNKILGMSYRARMGVKRIQQQYMMTQIVGKHKMQKCAVGLNIYTCQLRDEDGLNTALKYPLDYLEKQGYIPNDSPKHVTVSRPKQFKVSNRSEQKVVIIMQEIK